MSAEQEQDGGREPIVDQWDLVVIGGVCMLMAGLWLWAGLGVALTVVGALLLALGVAGARNATAAAETPAAGDAERRLGRVA